MADLLTPIIVMIAGADPLTIVIAMAAGFMGAFIGVIGGGGSLITLPVMMFFLPPHIAIATNRFGIVFATTSATASYYKRKVFNWKVALPIVIAAVLGGFLGANIMLTLDEAFLKSSVAVILIFAALFFLLNPLHGAKRQRKPKNIPIAYFLAFCVGIYSGIFGPATGSFYLAILVIFFGLDFMQAAGTKSFLTWCSSIIAAAVFVIHGVVDYSIGIPLAVGMVAGGWLGAKTAVAKGSTFIRQVFLVIVLLLAVSLLLQ